MLENLESQFVDLRNFVVELEMQGVFESVVLVTASDFGRRLTSNGDGTDHAWAGNYFLIGGDLQGGRVFNSFPASLLEGNEQDADHGRLIPMYPWESIEVPVAEWMGLEYSQRSAVFPNLANFNHTHIIETSMLFNTPEDAGTSNEMLAMIATPVSIAMIAETNLVLSTFVILVILCFLGE